MPKKIYMGGVCGMGMAPLALFAKSCGMDICGFDDHASKRVAALLEENGISVSGRFDADGAKSADAFVISSALKLRIGTDIPEGLNPIRRGKFLADEICRNRKLTAVVGSHGKSTVTAMLAHATRKLGAEAGYIVGAIPTGFSPSKFCEEGKPIFAEIDESDGTIENFSPEVCLALNADLDHIDQYADSSELAKMFERLFRRTKRHIVILAGDKILLDAALKSGKPFTQVEASSDFTETNARLAAEAFKRTLNLYKADEVYPNKKTFEDFGGVVRRQERFQPHRYTRTKRFAGEFAKILSEQDCPVYVAPVYAASEPFDPDGTSERIVRLSDKILPLGSFEEFDSLALRLAEDTKRDGIKRALAIVGAGDLYFQAKKIFKL